MSLKLSLFSGVKKIQKVEELQNLVCPACGANRFKILTRQVVYDVTNSTGSWKDGYENSTIEKEELLEISCVKCGKRLLQKYVGKPISKRAWDEFWNSYLTDFIFGVDWFLVCHDSDADEQEEVFLRGVVKGMWAVYNFIEKLMVQDKNTKGKKKKYHVTDLAEVRLCQQ